MRYLKFFYTLFILTICLCPTLSFSQPAQNPNAAKDPNEPPPLPLFHSFGYTTCMDYYQSPTINFIINPGGLAPYAVNESSTAKGLSLFTLIYRLRYNYYEPTNNMAFSASISPAFAAAYYQGVNNNVGDVGVGIFNMPVLAEFNFGAGATHRSYERIGGVIGLGFDYTYLPFVETTLLNNNQQLHYSYMNLCANFGYRFWGRYENLREVNFKIDFANGFGARVAFIRNFGF